MNIIQSAVTSPLGYRHSLHHAGVCDDDTKDKDVMDMMDVDAAWNRLDGVSDFRKTFNRADHLLELVTSKGFC